MTTSEIICDHINNVMEAALKNLKGTIGEPLNKDQLNQIFQIVKHRIYKFNDDLDQNKLICPDCGRMYDRIKNKSSFNAIIKHDKCVKCMKEKYEYCNMEE